MNIKPKDKVNMYEGSTNVGVFEVSGKIYIAMLFFNVDDRVEIFNEDEESIGLIFTSSSKVLFNDNEIGKVRYPCRDEGIKTMKMVLYKEDDVEEIIDSDVSRDYVECFIKAERFFTKYLIENNIITVPELIH